MKIPKWLSGKSTDEPPLPDPEAGLPKVDERAVAKEKRAAEIAEQQAERREERQARPGPAVKFVADKASEFRDPEHHFKTEGPKFGTKQPDLPEKVPSQLRNDPTPQAAPDKQTPENQVTYVRMLTPGGTKMVPSQAQPKQPETPVKPPYEQFKNAADNADKTTPGGDVEGR